jgi:SSS family transporter
MTPARPGFETLDWLVLALYFALLAATGWWFSRRVKGAQEFFLAGRAMPVWAVAVSVLATSLSAATFLGAPEQAYEADLTYLSATIGTILAALIVASAFVPAFYWHRVTTAYELLEVRFGVAARRAASAMFMLGRVFANGARVYIAAHALSYIVFADTAPAHLLLAAAVLTAAGVLYTIAGGIESVIWADAVQAVIFVGSVAAAILLLLWKIPAPLDELTAALRTAGEGGASKLTLISTTTDPRTPFTLWTALTGFTLLNLAALGTDQDLVQRMLTCRSTLKASWSVIWSQIIAIPLVAGFSILGLLLFVYYKRPDLMHATSLAEPPPGKESLLRFITQDMPPGMSGLMMAGLFAVGLTSLNSALNAMSSTFVSDFYRPLRPARREEHYLLVARLGVAGWGIVMGLFAAFCIWWQSQPDRAGTLLQLALGVMVYAYTGLLAVFCCALFTKRGSTRSVLAALAAGFLLTLALEPILFKLWAPRLGLPDAPLAFPWRMFFATAAAFLVCILGSRIPRPQPTIPMS